MRKIRRTKCFGISIRSSVTLQHSGHARMISQNIRYPYCCNGSKVMNFVSGLSIYRLFAFDTCILLRYVDFFGDAHCGPFPCLKFIIADNSPLARKGEVFGDIYYHIDTFCADYLCLDLTNLSNDEDIMVSRYVYFLYLYVLNRQLWVQTEVPPSLCRTSQQLFKPSVL